MTLFPILVDESIYLRWAEIIDHQGQWFVSLLDAKQPLSYWLYALIRKGLPTLDPLFGPRLVSVCAGLGSTALLFRLGQRLSGNVAGLTAAFLYAVLPFGVLYDRLAYTDALVNLFGIASTLASVEYFRAKLPTLWGAVIIGSLMGAGFFTKSTFALFAGLPMIAALVFRPWDHLLLIRRLVLIYGSALILPLISYLNVPNAPVFGINNLLFHHTSFFPPLALLVSRPLLNVSQNLELLQEYFYCYVTLPVAIAGLISILYLLLRKRVEAWFLAPLLLVPICFEVVALWLLHSRYVFPVVWPLMLLIGAALAESKKRMAVLAMVAVVTPAVVASIAILRHPETQLHQIEYDEFLSAGPYSGYGIREAVAFLKEKNTQSAAPLTLLTDPIFGTPADAFYSYLNLRNGMHVYEAWWLQLPGRRPILPDAPTEVMKSQYERVSAGIIDFPLLSPVYYVTDTNYNKPVDVAERDPHAKLIRRFPKHNGSDFIDIYQLR
jgi:4-amino-4-deoxy-L-arabinose transferase-like glycosyltransferase